LPCSSALARSGASAAIGNGKPGIALETGPTSLATRLTRARAARPVNTLANTVMAASGPRNACRGPTLYPFLVKHPLIELTLELNDRRVDAAAEGYDAVVRHGPLEDTRLTVWRLAVSQRVLVASPDYLARHGTPSSLADLRRHRAIHYTNRGGADWRFRILDGIGVTRGLPGLRVNNGDMMCDAAMAGVGIALLPSFIIGAAVRAGALAVIEIGATAEAEFIYMAHPESRHPSAKLRAVAECLREALTASPD